jgi:hypothetical protein
MLLPAAGFIFAQGCQSAHPIQSHRLIEHQAMVDFSGLKAVETLPEFKVNAAVPSSWEAVTPHKTALYTHGQWRAPSGRTAVGAALIRLPLPLSAKTVLWFAKGEYTKRSSDGKLIDQWIDELGRAWFEAENNKYHVRGYCLAQGFEAWVIYFGYKTDHPPEPTEISLAARCADTFVPRAGTEPSPAPASATASVFPR